MSSAPAPVDGRRLTYTVLDGRVLDLSDLGSEERTYFLRCLAAYRDGADYFAFSELVDQAEHNPLLRATGGWITRAVLEHPLFQAVDDLEARLGIRQGMVAPDPGDDPAREPVAEEWAAAVG